jgi:putative FmdB family regulatory protein
MPLFDLKCDECGAEFEELLPTAAEIATVQCPDCDGERVSRLLSGFAMLGGGGGSGGAGSSGCSSRGPFR